MESCLYSIRWTYYLSVEIFLDVTQCKVIFWTHDYMHCVQIPCVARGSFIKFMAWFIGEPLGCAETLKRLTQLKPRTQVSHKDGTNQVLPAAGDWNMAVKKLYIHTCTALWRPMYHMHTHSCQVCVDNKCCCLLRTFKMQNDLSNLLANNSMYIYTNDIVFW